MKLGPKTFDTTYDLIEYISEDVLGSPSDDSSVPTNPLRKAIYEHLMALDATPDSPYITAFNDAATHAGRTRLQRTLATELNEGSKALQKDLEHSFWDPLRKKITSIDDAIKQESEKDYITEPRTVERTDGITIDPRNQAHHIAIAQLHATTKFYRETYGTTELPTNKSFNDALDYIDNTLIPEMETSFGKNFVKNPEISSPRERFQGEHRVVSTHIAAWSEIESEESTRPGRIPGKVYKSYPNSWGFEGINPTARALGLE